jgi:hypothetical protein
MTPRPTGIAAQLAEARRMLRDASPDGAEDAVQAEVQRVQLERGAPLLAAMHAVHARLIAGWQPGAGPSGL